MRFVRPFSPFLSLNSGVDLNSILVWILVGLVAGFLASLIVTGRGRGWFWNLIIGIVGAFFGGWLASQLHISLPFADIINRIITAFAGAVILLLIWRLIFRRGK